MLTTTVGAAADLDPRAVGRGHEIRPRSPVQLEHTAKPPRLRHGKAARLGSGTAGHVGDGTRVSQPESGGGQTPIQGPQIARADPAQHQILLGRDPNRAVTVRARQIADHAHLRAREIPEGNRHGDDHEPEVLLRPHIGLAPVRVLVAADLKQRYHGRHDAGTLDRLRLQRHARRSLYPAPAARPCSQPGRLLRIRRIKLERRRPARTGGSD